MTEDTDFIHKVGECKCRICTGKVCECGHVEYTHGVNGNCLAGKVRNGKGDGRFGGCSCKEFKSKVELLEKTNK